MGYRQIEMYKIINDSTIMDCIHIEMYKIINEPLWAVLILKCII